MATKDLTRALSSPKFAYFYAKDVINGPWPLGEALIAQHAGCAYCYARDVIKGRFPEGEAVIAQNAGGAYLYAEYVIRDRWPLGEAAIAQDPYWASVYYKLFKDQFTEREKVLWLLKI